LFGCDVDGVLTDSGVWMGEAGEAKRFNIRDGLGLRLLQRAGIRVAWVSHRESVATTRRAADLKVDFLHQSSASKSAVIERILGEMGLTWAAVCFMGDDLVDLGALRRAGLAVTVPDSVAEARAVAHYTTRAAAGHGAVREVAEMILQAQGQWAPLVEEYSA
jgi:3-deoxy-D-manno-octulosonate 8-phosphate phosphatase (KDO 8-P phosphatase)